VVKVCIDVFSGVSSLIWLMAGAGELACEPWEGTASHGLCCRRVGRSSGMEPSPSGM